MSEETQEKDLILKYYPKTLEELKIRDDLNARTSNTLKEVFKLQDHN